MTRNDFQINFFYFMTVLMSHWFSPLRNLIEIAYAPYGEFYNTVPFYLYRQSQSTNKGARFSAMIAKSAQPVAI